MLEISITDQETNQTITKYTIVVDAHSHVGADEEKVQNLNPMAPSGTIDFYKRLYHKFIKSLSKDITVTRLKSTEPKNHGDYRINWSVCPPPPLQALLESLSKNCQCGTHQSAVKIFEKSWLVDLGIIFPFHDTFRNRLPEAEYHASNLNIQRVIGSYPGALRFIGYLRINPYDNLEKALKEIEFNARRGLRGMKLHPRSDLWLDGIVNQTMIRVLQEAAKWNLPVIFDTRGKRSIEDIYHLTKQTLAKLNSIPREQLKVIIAHCAHGNIGDEEIYEILCQPNCFGEISMLHGEAVRRFYKEFATYYQQHQKDKTNGVPWSRKIMFGTDFPFFQDHHALSNILYLTSKEFLTKVGTIEDTSNILGRTILHLLASQSWEGKQAQRVPIDSQTYFSKGKKDNEIISAEAQLTQKAVVPLFEQYPHITAIEYLDYAPNETRGDFSVTLRDKKWEKYCKCSMLSLVRNHFAVLLDNVNSQTKEYYSLENWREIHANGQ
ncbi:MAG: amidohydrolase family protein [Candidatus Heimdallarchaeota archaeon]|nr:amidohydrolase family protein [Candidatus Heimdallarchaeota archaeon]